MIRLTNEQVRKRWKTAKVESDLLAQRLQWLCDQIDAPQDTVQMRASMLGRLGWEPEETITRQGFTTASANPWACQLEWDLMFLTGDKYKGLYDKTWVEELNEADLTTFQQYKTTNEVRAEMKQELEKTARKRAQGSTSITNGD